MREQMACNERKMQCPHVLPVNVVFKDVVVIGNGPSGLCTSYMLSGWLPHLAPGPPQTSDEMLTARLSSLTPGQCLLDADLSELAEGLEGRSHNPVPLLMDNLQYPCADMGLDLDPLLEWRFHPDKQVDHIVLGSGPAGGAWHSFASKVLTLSPARWLSLPPHRSPLGAEGEGLQRAQAQAVADYYRQYVSRMGLQQYFRSGVMVHGVRRVRSALATLSCCPACPLRAAWCVQGYDLQSGEEVTYVARRVVLACGSSDLPHRLPAAACASDTVHAANTDDVLDTHCSGPDSLPVLVVGSGLSAADAVFKARSSGASVLHVYRKAAAGLRDLSPSVYPEYHQIYQMMCKGTAGKFERYTALPEHEIQHVCFTHNTKTESKPGNAQLKPKLVKLVNTVTDATLERTVCAILVLIGSRPNLNFLPDDFNTNLFNLRISERTRKNRKPSDRTDGGLDACCEGNTRSRDRRSWTFDAVSEWDRDRVSAHTDAPEYLIKTHNADGKWSDTSICLKCAYNNHQATPRFESTNNKKKCKKNELKSRSSNLKQVLGQRCKSHDKYEEKNTCTQIDEKDDSTDKENYHAGNKKNLGVNEVLNCDLNKSKGGNYYNTNGDGGSIDGNSGCNGKDSYGAGGVTGGTNSSYDNRNASCSNGIGRVNLHDSYINGSRRCLNRNESVSIQSVCSIGEENDCSKRSCGNNVGSCGNNVGSCGNNVGSCGNNVGSCGNNVGSCGNNVGSCGNNVGSCGNNVGSCGNNVGSCGNNVGSCGNNVGSCGNNVGSLSNSNERCARSVITIDGSYVDSNEREGCICMNNDDISESMKSSHANGDGGCANGNNSCNTNGNNSCNTNGNNSCNTNGNNSCNTNGGGVNRYFTSDSYVHVMRSSSMNGSDGSGSLPIRNIMSNEANIENRETTANCRKCCNENFGCNRSSGSGLGYGLDPTKPIDCRANPMNVDKRTHRVRNFGEGLYALGPLTGDNFVRFIPGGALAIVAHMWNETKNCK